MVNAEHPLFVLYTSGSTGQTEGRAAFDRWLPAACDADHEVDVRHQTERRFLVHRRRGLGDRPHLLTVWPAAVDAALPRSFEACRCIRTLAVSGT